MQHLQGSSWPDSPVPLRWQQARVVVQRLCQFTRAYLLIGLSLKDLALLVGVAAGVMPHVLHVPYLYVVYRVNRGQPSICQCYVLNNSKPSCISIVSPRVLTLLAG